MYLLFLAGGPVEISNEQMEKSPLLKRLQPFSTVLRNPETKLQSLPLRLILEQLVRSYLLLS